ncbi:MAG: hypothetical protein LBB14_02800 [Puniceicoccales bacterium]|jgi:hypothetical protein|nr:hypothetical protein [Puniceicoccales bacterium]
MGGAAPDRHFLERFAAARAAGRLPHGILLEGKNLAILEATARAAAHFLVPANSLDLLAVRPEGKSRQIGVDAVRELIGRLQLSPRGPGSPVAIVHGADRLHRNAANALLKTLEEPPPGVLLLLTARRIGNVLPTIQSRCQLHRCRSPGESHPEWAQWLEGYKSYVRKCLNDPGPAQLLDAYGLAAGFRALLGAAVAEDKNDPQLTAERAGLRRVMAESLLAECAEGLLSLAKELPQTDGNSRRLKMLHLSRQMAALGRAVWLLEKNCSEIAAVESFLLATGIGNPH